MESEYNPIEWGPFQPIGADSVETLPQFETVWLPYPFNKFAEQVAKSCQVAPDMVAIAELAAVSATICRKIYVQGGPVWIEPTELYCAIVAPPSERKSPVAKLILAPFHDYECEKNKVIAAEIEENKSRRELLKEKIKKEKDPAELEKLQAELKEIPDLHKLRLWVNDVTPERLAGILQENGERIFIPSTEGQIFKIIEGRYNQGRTNSELFLSCFNEEPYSMDRINREPVSLDHPAITMLQFIQPQVIEEMIYNKDLAGNGLTARFMYVFPRPMAGHRTVEDIPMGTAREEYNEAITKLLSMNSGMDTGVVLTLDKDAKESFNGFREFVEKMLGNPEISDARKNWLGKLCGLCLRIAGVIHAMHWQDSATITPNIDCSAMESAIDICSYLTVHASYAFDELGVGNTPAEKEAMFILQRMEHRLLYPSPKSPISPNEKKLFSMQELYQAVKGGKRGYSMEELRFGLEELRKRCYLSTFMDCAEGSKKPREWVVLNPEYLNTLSKK